MDSPVGIAGNFELPRFEIPELLVQLSESVRLRRLGPVYFVNS